MKSLGRRELRLFCNTLRALYSPVTTGSFPAHLAAALGAVIANCSVAIDDVDIERRHKLYGTAQMARTRPNCFAEVAPVGIPISVKRTTSRNSASGTGTDHYITVVIPRGRGVTRLSFFRRDPFSPPELDILKLLSPHIAQAHANAARLMAAEAHNQENTHVHASELRHAHLTPREAEVFRWVAVGKRNREIGLILHTSERTIQKQVQSILGKVGVETRSGATAWWFEHGGNSHKLGPA